MCVLLCVIACLFSGQPQVWVLSCHLEMGSLLLPAAYTRLAGPQVSCPFCYSSAGITNMQSLLFQESQGFELGSSRLLSKCLTHGSIYLLSYLNLPNYKLDKKESYI